MSDTESNIAPPSGKIGICVPLPCVLAGMSRQASSDPSTRAPYGDDADDDGYDDTSEGFDNGDYEDGDSDGSDYGDADGTDANREDPGEANGELGGGQTQDTW